MKTTKLTPAAEILDESVLDIDAGRWICHDLAQNICKKTPNEKPKADGCALGLLGVNGGNTFVSAFGALSLLYPDACELGKWNEESKTAMRVLASVIPNDDAIRYTDNSYTDGARQDAIVTYNDGLSEQENAVELAREWFDAARVKAIALGL